ncbi:MAG: type II toxin-antitoxin system RelE/ParE family toxin [Gammaproteobacteria bacterium]|nr:type II toxin-antitoxin system RelE/ParE family toxin [Gammaproteobacteria bacterium]
MAKVLFTEQAKLDLKDIANYIAEDNKKAALAYIKLLRGKCKKLSDAPKIGTQRGALRMFPVGSYLLFYREVKNGIEIIRILHASRNVEKIIE